ncbi:shikimate kinase [Jannaschia sp. R86511]|uniref:shikimate kinase n=1 Tax=Jannaschia sp. R86511 TaxID=3093853 RepID=UPI0036D3CCB3
MPDAPVLVLVGPAAAGKSTLGTLVAARLGVPFVDLDAVGDQYYAEVGWTVDRLVARTGQIGRVPAEREWEPARAHAVRRVLQDHPGAVVALGAGHTSYDDPTLAHEVGRALSTVPHVLLVRPSEDRTEALAELRERAIASKGTDWVAGGHDFLAHWLDDQNSRTMATAVVLTGRETPEQTAARIVDLVRSHHPVSGSR